MVDGEEEKGVMSLCRGRDEGATLAREKRRKDR